MMLEQYRVLRGGKRRHDRAADRRVQKAAPAALAADRARKATPEARARDAARKYESRREARALADALALLENGGAMRQ